MMRITYKITDTACDFLPEWFAVYTECFADVPEEAEDYDGFLKALSLNEASPSSDLGHHTEVVLAAYIGSELVGGAQYVMFVWEGNHTCMLNYIFVSPKHRNKGIAADIFDQVQRLIYDSTIFIEHKPSITLWNKLGAEVFDPNYIQPALRPGDEPTPLVLSVLRKADKVLMTEHLVRYERFSCRKLA